MYMYTDSHVSNVKYETAVPLISASILPHKTFMDTVGRTSLTLTAMNVIDESRDEDLLVSSRLSVTSVILKTVD